MTDYKLSYLELKDFGKPNCYLYELTCLPEKITTYTHKILVINRDDSMKYSWSEYVEIITNMIEWYLGFTYIKSVQVILFLSNMTTELCTVTKDNLDIITLLLKETVPGSHMWFSRLIDTLTNLQTSITSNTRIEVLLVMSEQLFEYEEFNTDMKKLDDIIINCTGENKLIIDYINLGVKSERIAELIKHGSIEGCICEILNPGLLSSTIMTAEIPLLMENSVLAENIYTNESLILLPKFGSRVYSGYFYSNKKQDVLPMTGPKNEFVIDAVLINMMTILYHIENEKHNKLDKMYENCLFYGGLLKKISCDKISIASVATITTEVSGKIFSIISKNAGDFGKLIESQIINDQVYQTKRKKKITDRVYQNSIEMKKFDINLQTIKSQIDFKSLAIEDVSLKKSKDMYMSVLSQTDWTEELENTSCMGLLVKVNTSELAKYGFNFSNAELETVNTSLIPTRELLHIIDWHREQNGYRENTPYIEGMAIGAGNSVMPLYINNTHWKISSQYMKPMLGIMLINNPAGYTKSYAKFPFHILMCMISQTYRQPVNDKWLNYLFALTRTCTQLAKQEKYDKGVRRLVRMYLDDPLFRTSELVSTPTVILGQILATGYIIKDSDFNNLLDIMTEEIIRKYIRKLRALLFDKMPEISEQKNHIPEIQKIFYAKHTPDISVALVIDKILLGDPETILHQIAVLPDIQKFLKILFAFKKFYVMMTKNILKQTSYKQFVKALDDNYGMLSDIQLSNLKAEVKVSTDDVKFYHIYDNNTTYVNKRVLLYVAQAIMHDRNKTRKEAIRTDKYLDLRKTLKN